MIRITLVLLIGLFLQAFLLGTEYRIGVGKHAITDPAFGLVMAGFGKPDQTTQGIRHDLYARAFIVEDMSTRKRIVLLNTDLWVMTHALKRAVINQLNKHYGKTYGFDNCLFMATHHHSGPGGYSEYNLYNFPIGGFDQTNFGIIVHGIVKAIMQAHEQMADGHIYYGETTILDCGRNRSLEAYRMNPAGERHQYAQPTDNTMYLLQFTQVDEGQETLLGTLNWYAIHPTGFGQYNRLVSGDNKGVAAAMVEECYPGIVAAFANGSAGDVSGNVEFGGIPLGIDDELRVTKLAKQQARATMELLWSPKLRRLSGALDYRHQWWDMSKRTGSVGALGVSFGAGSLEDGDSGLPFREGMTLEATPRDEERRLPGLHRKIAYLGNSPILKIESPGRLTASRVQYPKPVILYTGAKVSGAPLTPNVLPFQLVRLGKIVLAGFPAEMNTMAGRRLQSAIKGILPDALQVIPVSFANQYAQYVATPEEYDAQHYEGASTLFGRNTLAEYLKIYSGLARALKYGHPARTVSGHFPQNYLRSGKVFYLNRITVRNYSANSQTIQFFKHGDRDHRKAIREITVHPHGELGVIFPYNAPTQYVARIKNGNLRVVPTARANLLSITAEGVLKNAPFTIQSPVSSASH